MATVILIIAIGGLSSAVVSTNKLARESEETALAYAALKEMTETIQAVDFADVFATFNADPNDDPDGAGTAPGQSFAVFGLDAQPNDADGLAGRITFPTIAGAGGLDELREDDADVTLGMPRDLNGDGAVDNLDHSGDYLLLPLNVQIQWQGANGNRALDVSILISG